MLETSGKASMGRPSQARVPAAARATQEEVARHRNREGGFWVAEALPAAAEQSVQRTWAREEVEAVLLTTDGVSCGVAPYALFDWRGGREMARAEGVQSLLDAVRAAEAEDAECARWPRTKVHDDQAAVYLDFTA